LCRGLITRRRSGSPRSRCGLRLVRFERFERFDDHTSARCACWPENIMCAIGIVNLEPCMPFSGAGARC
jgi:hypothetical protein